MPDDAPEMPLSKEEASSDAKRALESYDLFNLSQQLLIARELGVNPKLIQDVRSAQFILHDHLLTQDFSAEQLTSCTADLIAKIETFSQIVKRTEKENTASIKERAKAANLQAKLILSRLDAASIDEQLRIALSLGVDNALVTRLRKVKYLVDSQPLDPDTTVVEREALVANLQSLVPKFHAAVNEAERKDPSRTERRILAARTNARNILRNYDERNIPERMEAASKQVTPEILKSLREKKFALEDHLNSANDSPTQLEAMSVGLQKEVDAFLRKLDLIEENEADQDRLQSLDRELNR